MKPLVSRREVLAAGAFLAAAAGERPATSNPGEGRVRPTNLHPFRYCLNTGTLMGHKLPLAEEVEIAAKAGYQGIEPWIRAVQQHVDQGKPLADLRKRIADLGLTVESAIGFAAWIVDDDQKRAAGLEQLKREMDLVAQLGGRRIAAPPAGAHQAPLDLRRAAERYRAVLELGRQTGVLPQLEIWGSSKSLHLLGQAAFVAIEAGHPDAAVLLDVFHIYRGGSDFAGLKVFSGASMHVFHMNDYPADPPREKATDADRIFPGDGVAPLGAILRTLHDVGFRGALSLELFNRTYWKQEPMDVARTGLEKMRAVVEKALA